MKSAKFIGTACMLGTTISYGLVPALSFMAFETGVVTETLLFNKFFYAAIVLWIYVLIKRIPFRLERKAIKPMIAIIIAYIGITNTLYLSFDYISGSLATIISFTFPAMVVAVEMIRGNEKVRAMKILAVILSLAGLCLIVWSPDMEVKMLGVFFALACAVCYTVYTLTLNSDNLKDVHSFVPPAYIMLACSIFNGTRCYISGEPLFTENAVQLAYMLALAIICVFVAIILFCIGVRLIGPSNASIINTFEPVFACVFGYLLVDDIITWSMAIGGFMVVAAVLITNLPDKKGTREELEESQ